jgi:hypothetical protein
MEISVEWKQLIDNCLKAPNGDLLLEFALSDCSDEFIEAVLKYIEDNYG